MKIIIDENIPYIRGRLEPLAEVVYADQDKIDADLVRDADIIIIRTRTRADASLLEGSRVKTVATATIGTDHIDKEWCAANGVSVASAPGCNAPGVAQYVMAALYAFFGGDAGRMRDATLGIVGVGHVGSIVDKWARSVGMTTLLCDPPRAEHEGAGGFVTLDEIARRADAITFHTPLTSTPDPWPTLHMIDDAFVGKLRRKPLLINSARGPVADTAALIRGYDAGLTGALAIDCWEGEPEISGGLLSRALIATPHIAGYSLQGKMRASQMAVDAVTAHFGLPPVKLECGEAPHWPEAVTIEELGCGYSPLAYDTPQLKAHPGKFEWFRDNYRLRTEPGCE